MPSSVHCFCCYCYPVTAVCCTEPEWWYGCQHWSLPAAAAAASVVATAAAVVVAAAAARCLQRLTGLLLLLSCRLRCQLLLFVLMFWVPAWVSNCCLCYLLSCSTHLTVSVIKSSLLLLLLLSGFTLCYCCHPAERWSAYQHGPSQLTLLQVLHCSDTIPILL